MIPLPPEPDPATAVPCPCCGDPISPEGLQFLKDCSGLATGIHDNAPMFNPPDDFDAQLARNAFAETDEAETESQQDREDRRQEDRGDLMRDTDTE